MDGQHDAWQAEPPRRPANLVRPYVLTSGRTEANIALAFEALIATMDYAPTPRWPGSDVRTQILRLGVERASVAEIAARLALPLGVARVLIGDLVTQGYVQVQDTLGERSTFDERRELIGRTLRGLRAL